MDNTPLSIMMIRARYELRHNIDEIKKQSGLPPYILSGILSEIIAELRAEEKEELAVLYVHDKEAVK